ncbi:MAG TPA: hypothetical protein VGO30_18280 [Mycobacterium sp.]|jgi:hypothetical protein|nr:hypothetical protein [Mycobacterium sp.]
MAAQDATEQVPPTEIAKGDEIADELGKRWLTVNEIRVVSAADGGMFSFYGDGPDDRATFEGHELVRRRVH